MSDEWKFVTGIALMWLGTLAVILLKANGDIP